MVLIKKNVLSASIATVLLGSTGAFAANDRGFTSDTDWSEEQAGFNGHVGTTFEYETKSTDNYLGKTVKEYTKTHEIFQAYFSQGNDSNLLIVFYVQIMPDDFVMQLHRF